MLELRERTEGHVRVYHEKTQDKEIMDSLPGSDKSLEDALRMYAESRLPSAKSVGRTIYYDGEYVGDVWCYALGEEPDAMLSYCVFEKRLWGNGIATQAVRLFIEYLKENYGVKTIGAFAYTDNLASVNVLEKNAFSLVERFVDDGRASAYFERTV